jgi:hypothetical protein
MSIASPIWLSLLFLHSTAFWLVPIACALFAHNTLLYLLCAFIATRFIVAVYCMSALFFPYDLSLESSLLPRWVIMSPIRNPPRTRDSGALPARPVPCSATPGGSTSHSLGNEHTGKPLEPALLFILIHGATGSPCLCHKHSFLGSRPLLLSLFDSLTPRPCQAQRGPAPPNTCRNRLF